MSNEKLIDKIKKLLAKANGTDIQAEADSFIAHANKLMLEHNLGLTDIDVEDDDENGITGQREFFVIDENTDSAWQVQLLSVITEHLFCKVVRTKRMRSKESSFSIIGSVANIEMTAYTFSAARAAIERISAVKWNEYVCEKLLVPDTNDLSKKDIKLLMDYAMATPEKIWMKSYKLGAVSGLSDKFRADRDAARAANSNQFGLVKSKNMNAIEKHMNLMFDNLRKGRASNTGRVDYGAMNKGRADGRSLSLSKGVGEARSGNQRAIGG